MNSEESTGDAGYPIDLKVARPESQSRITNFPLAIGTLIRFILAIPHLIVLYFLAIAAGIVYFLATFAILFTGNYPRGLFNFVLGFTRWNTGLTTYLMHLHDSYPPFTTDPPVEYPLSLSAQYPAMSSRLLNFPFLGYFIRGILLIPHVILLAFLMLAVYLVIFIAQFAILITGAFPAGMHGFCVGVSRWSFRTTAYMYGLTDRYPPFSLQE